MSRRYRFLAIVILACGCSHRSYNVANPVVGPAPPRIRNSEQYAAAQSPDYGIEQVSNKTGVIPMSAVVARVNGSPVLAGEVFEEFLPKLVQIRAQTSDQEFRRAQEMLLTQVLPRRIEQQLMVDQMKSKLKQENLDAVEKQIDKFFEAQVDEMKKKAGVGTVADLEAKLQAEGLSLATMRKTFGDGLIAQQFVQSQIRESQPPTRQELLAEYESRKAEFEEPAQVRWQQLQISIDKHGRAEAERRMQQALVDLRNGDSFDTIVRRYSDSVTTLGDGHWDWMQPESVALPQLREAIENVAVGQFSDVIETKSSLQVVKITGRRQKRVKPLSEVQAQLTREMNDREREATAKKMIAELKSKAIIESYYVDLPEASI